MKLADREGERDWLVCRITARVLPRPPVSFARFRNRQQGSRPRQRKEKWEDEEKEERKSFEWVIKYADRATRPSICIHSIVRPRGRTCLGAKIQSMVACYMKCTSRLFGSKVCLPSLSNFVIGY